MPIINSLPGYQGRPTELVANIFEAEKTPQARIEAFKLEFPRLMADAMKKDHANKMLGRDVRAENSFVAGITTNFLTMGAVTILGPKCAPLAAFSRGADTDPYKPRAIGVVKFNQSAQDGSDVEHNSTNFVSNSDSIITGPVINVDQLTVKLHLTSQQINSGFEFADLMEAKLNSLQSEIMQVVTAPMTVANFSENAALIINPAEFGLSDSATLLGQMKRAGKKNLILDGEYISRLTNISGFANRATELDGLDDAWKAYGWNMIALNTEWQGAGPSVRGFANNPTAIGVISGLPMEWPDQEVIQTATVLLKGANIVVTVYLWVDANARTWRASYDVMLGAGLLDPSAGVIIQTP